MIAYKAFRKDLTCTLGRGKFQYEEGKTYREDTAKCARGGFHSTNNPLDTLIYYPDMDNSVYYIVRAGGDINEDGEDSRIASTELTLLKRLTTEEFVIHAMNYVWEHPKRAAGKEIQREKAQGNKWFAIARGKNPAAKGPEGCILGCLKEKKDSDEIEEMAVYIAGQDGIKPDCFYDIDGKEIKEGAEEKMAGITG
ncbi:MAG: hypothetical protein NC300_11335 [Bacteroidales bacterium]|nr:hypothetical protein [Clostridium sp.]MCM1204724.1 hypothetical protein [Bacteroidales bacterium]